MPAPVRLVGGLREPLSKQCQSLQFLFKSHWLCASRASERTLVAPHSIQPSHLTAFRLDPLRPSGAEHFGLHLSGRPTPVLPVLVRLRRRLRFATMVPSRSLA